MTIQVDFNNAQNWEDVYSINLTTSQGDGTKAPIQDLDVPYLFDTNILNIFASSQSASPRWQTAGYVKKLVRTGIVLTNSNVDTVQSSRRLFLSGNLIIYPLITEEYSLRIKTHSWIQDIRYDVFRYIGPILASTDDLISQIFNVQLPRIENKIDAIDQTTQ